MYSSRQTSQRRVLTAFAHRRLCYTPDFSTTTKHTKKPAVPTQFLGSRTMYHLTNSVKDRKVSEAGRQENGELDPGGVRDHVQSGKEIMTERTENARR